MLKERYFVKIVPQRGETVHRFEICSRQLLAAIAGALVILLGSLTFAGVQVASARERAESLAKQTGTQQTSLDRIHQQTETLRRQLQAVQRQNQEIQQLIGVPANGHVKKVSFAARGTDLASAGRQLSVLAAASRQTGEESNRMRSLALRVLNIRRIGNLARAQILAAIPSIDPVAGAVVTGCFCWRTSPDVEFHKGVDLGASYGETVRASAAGTVVAAGWDGEYGIKVDIDHGNGYHTWYAHLSRADVTPGQRVFKSETIGAVGATGFSTGPHLHYQLMRDGVPIDPAPYLHGVPPNVLASLP
ncbi:MAG: peptidoglycan DD-metalloendopeptidase family protein [Vulcanimicrobiaceae bacterium]